MVHSVISQVHKKFFRAERGKDLAVKLKLRLRIIYRKDLGVLVVSDPPVKLQPDTVFGLEIIVMEF